MCGLDSLGSKWPPVVSRFEHGNERMERNNHVTHKSF
jgi:hypothetical protein